MNFQDVQQLISSRRSCKPALMNGKKIEDAVIRQLLELADWAPTHGHTEPWRLVVFAHEAVQQFCKAHAALYKENIPAEKLETSKYEKLLHNGDNVSHIIAVCMKRGTNPKITAKEEICAVAAAVQNILLGASAVNISALWSTGGMTLQPAMKHYFGLNEADEMIGLLYLGYSDKTSKNGERIIPLQEKIEWRG
jgi:nitroreductase